MWLTLNNYFNIISEIIICIMELFRFIEYGPGEFRGAFLFIYLKKDIANVCSIMYNALYRVTAADLFEEGTDLDRIRELTLEVHAMVHPAEISGRKEKTIADYVLDYMMDGNRDALVPREDYDIDLHYAGTRTVPMCWQFWHTYRIEDLVSRF